MRKYYTLLSVFICISVLIPSLCWSQTVSFSKSEALQLVKKNRELLHFSSSDVENLVISDCYYNKAAATHMVYIQQTFQSIPLFNVIKTIAFRNERVVSQAGSFVSNITYIAQPKDGIPTIQPIDAVNTSLKEAGISSRLGNSDGVQINKTFNFGKQGIAQQDITVKLMWVRKEKGIKLCWQVKLAPVSTADVWLMNVDANKNELVNKINLTIYDDWGSAVKGDNTAITEEKRLSDNARDITSAGYRVIAYPAESMTHPGGTPVLVTTPWLNAGTNSPATSLGWHNDGTTDHDSTRGNNVWAREDRANNNGNPTPGKAAVSTTASPSLSFDFAFNPNTSVISGDNQKFAITQLFYWNNIIHDITYLYGFDEVSGNFQNANQGRGGLGNDFVFADAQDGSGKNNANFSTQEDGINPRMQMYLFESSSQLFTLNSPSSIAGSKTASEGNVSINNAVADKGPITADVVLYSTTGVNDGCTLISNPLLAGKIAMVDRGTCSFAIKIKNAQLAGAAAVIVVNNTTGAPFSMSGSDNTIIIPAVMITQADGTTIKNTIQAGTAVNVTLKSLPLDGDLDNGIIGHEYAHGISNRLTGGPAAAGCLTNAEQMGEGWSDYYALMTTTNWATATVNDGSIRRPIGTYVYKQNYLTGSGIRTYPYTTDMVINKWTYGLLSTTGGQVHRVGEIWATVLWDMTWQLIQVAGINPNMYNAGAPGGNSIALRLVTEGMKLQPCGPGFLDGRDAILKADTLLYNGQYSCAIWKAFARRGMGVSAVQGSADNVNDQVAAFDLPKAIINKVVDKAVVAMNDKLTYTFTASCQCEAVSGFTIIDTLPSNVTYVSGGVYNNVNRTVQINVPPLAISQSFSSSIEVNVNIGSYTPPVQHITDAVNSAVINPLLFSATSSAGVNWTVNSSRSKSPSFSYFVSDTSVASNLSLTTTGFFDLTGISTLSFWHYFNTEETYDGGVVEITTNNGASWSDLGPYMYQNPYNSSVGALGTKGFSGSSNGQFIQTLVNLAAFKDKQVRFRFKFASDQAVGGEGWYIDDIELKSEAGVYNIAQLFSATNQLISSSDTLSMIINLIPVRWGSFTVKKEGGNAILNWTTLQEQNSEIFIIEKSLDGDLFYPIGSIAAKRNSNTLAQYNFTDKSPVKGVNYYRIRQVDRDGNYRLSAIRSVIFEMVKEGISVFPNPAKDKIVVTVKDGNLQKELLLTNTKGQIIKTFILKQQSNLINLPQLPSGVYYLRVSGEKAFKLIIE